MGTPASLFLMVFVGGALLFAVGEWSRFSGDDSDKGLHGFETNQNDAHDQEYLGHQWSLNSDYPCQDAAHDLLSDMDDWGWHSDEELKQAVECQLATSLFIKTEQIDVSVNNGTVTLRGTVRDWDSVRNAIDEAYLTGVNDVVNELEVVNHV
jgi:hypothetical protein